VGRIDIRSIRRDQILQATEALVAERGWENATFAEICRSAGVSNRVLTYHFKDKDDILLSLLEQTVARLRAAVLASLPADGRPTETLSKAFCAVLQQQGQQQHIWRLGLYFLSQAPYRPEIAERMRLLMRGATQRIVEAIERDMPVGVAPSVDTEGVALAIQACVFGALLLRTALDIAVPAAQLDASIRGHLRAARHGDAEWTSNG